MMTWIFHNVHDKNLRRSLSEEELNTTIDDALRDAADSCLEAAERLRHIGKFATDARLASMCAEMKRQANELKGMREQTRDQNKNSISLQIWSGLTKAFF